MADNQLVLADGLIPDEPDYVPEPDITPDEPEKGKKKKPRQYGIGERDPLNRYLARRRAQSILALKLEGRKPRDIAAELNIPVKTVYWALYQLRRGGHLEAANEVADCLTHSLKPLVVERLQERLEDPNVDQDLLIAAAKGTGIFVDHQKLKSEGANPSQQLVVRFDVPPGATPSAIGEIHGVPMPAIEGEIV